MPHDIKEIGRPLFFTTEKEEEFLELLFDNAGHIGNTCAQIGITRRAYYYHCNDYPEFKEKAEKIRVNASSIIEDTMLDVIRTGKLPNGNDANNTLIIFYLKSINREKYGDKQHLTVNVDSEKVLNAALKRAKEAENL